MARQPRIIFWLPGWAVALLALGLLLLTFWLVEGQDGKDPVAALKRELQWTQSDHARCKQALADLWAQGDALEKEAAALREQVKTLEADRTLRPAATEEK